MLEQHLHISHKCPEFRFMMAEPESLVMTVQEVVCLWGNNWDSSPTRLWEISLTCTVSLVYQLYGIQRMVVVWGSFTQIISQVAHGWGGCVPLPEWKSESVGCSPSACVWNQDYFPPPSNIHGRPGNGCGTETKNKTRGNRLNSPSTFLKCWFHNRFGGWFNDLQCF